jgi:chorismate mutase / prephenate dehydratase
MEDTKKLAEIRSKIDIVDEQLLELLNQRAQLALQARIAKGGKAVHRPEREAEILERISELNDGPLSGEAVQTLFHSIIFVCRSIQEVEIRSESITGIVPELAADRA